GPDEVEDDAGVIACGHAMILRAGCGVHIVEGPRNYGWGAAADHDRAGASAKTRRWCGGVTVAKQLLERDGELARIQTLIESALAGDGRYSMCEGPAEDVKNPLERARAGEG